MARLLLIDDNVTFIESLAAALRAKDVENEITTALSAEDALRLLHARDFDVVISDVRMYGLNGLGFVAECASVRPDTPVILITGHGDTDLEQKAIRLGAYAFIHKPVDAEAVHITIMRALLRRHLLKRGGQVQLNPAELNARKVAMYRQHLIQRIHELDNRLQDQLNKKEKPKTDT
ncbi:MAG: response regulator [Nitrospiraceae bacterium]